MLFVCTSYITPSSSTNLHAGSFYRSRLGILFTNQILKLKGSFLQAKIFPILYPHFFLSGSAISIYGRARFRPSVRDPPMMSTYGSQKVGFFLPMIEPGYGTFPLPPYIESAAAAARAPKKRRKNFSSAALQSNPRKEKSTFFCLRRADPKRSRLVSDMSKGYFNRVAFGMERQCDVERIDRGPMEDLDRRKTFIEDIQ